MKCRSSCKKYAHVHKSAGPGPGGQARTQGSSRSTVVATLLHKSLKNKTMTQALDPKQCLFTNLGCKLEPRREGLVESIWESCGDIRVASWRHLEVSWKHLEASGNVWRHLGDIWRYLEDIPRYLGEIWRHVGGWEESGVHLQASSRWKLLQARLLQH